MFATNFYRSLHRRSNSPPTSENSRASDKRTLNDTRTPLFSPRQRAAVVFAWATARRSVSSGEKHGGGAAVSSSIETRAAVAAVAATVEVYGEERKSELPGHAQMLCCGATARSGPSTTPPSANDPDHGQ
uniref:Uncharacterized protein n=1 Tax=Plectus sambesii TaxID=2011161 RepID=A0A914XQH5_9BILA